MKFPALQEQQVWGWGGKVGLCKSELTDGDKAQTGAWGGVDAPAVPTSTSTTSTHLPAPAAQIALIITSGSMMSTKYQL